MLDRKAYFIREHVGLLKLSDTYDILDPETKAQLGVAQERPGVLVLLLRLLISKRLLPTSVFVYEGSNAEDRTRLLFSLERGASVFTPKVEICDKSGKAVGYLISKLFSIGGAFRVHDAAGKEFAKVQGDWKGWSFKITDTAEKEIGTISRKWGGMGKELFTSADNYVIALHGEPNPGSAILLLAAGLAVDTIFKEK